MKKADELLSAIQRVSKKIRVLKEDELQKSHLQDFSLAHFKYIEEIHSMKNPTFVELSNRLHLSKPTVTIMVAKLIERGFVTKTKSPEDGRTYHVTLTEKGEKIIAGYNKVYDEFITQTVSKFNNDELDVLISLLHRI